MVEEQLNELRKSGLYDAADRIIVGVLGDERLISHLLKATKVEVLYRSGNIREFEYPTLNLMHQAANNGQFNGLYFHTKGVSYPKKDHGVAWRYYMQDYVIRRWRECVQALNEGADLCGVKYLPRRDKRDNPGELPHPAHFSGNFWWARSDYIRKLLPVDCYDRDNRWLAEFWSCSRDDHKARSLCQLMINNFTKTYP